MNRDRIEGQWKQIKGRLRERWGRLTDDHLDVIAGRHDKLLGALQANYGLARENAGRTAEKIKQKAAAVADEKTRRIARDNADLIGR